MKVSEKKSTESKQTAQRMENIWRYNNCLIILKIIRSHSADKPEGDSSASVEFVSTLIILRIKGGTLWYH